MSSHPQHEYEARSVESMPWRVVFMGTPAFVVPTLDALWADPSVEVVAAYTPPDRRRGRGQVFEATPVKQRALELDIPVEQPATLRNSDAVGRLASYTPDVIVVAAYGRLLPADALAIPPFGCLNLHPSLLPRHRGPSPVTGAILAGDDVTGITIMLLDEGMDTGPIVALRQRRVGPESDAAQLTETLFIDGAALLAETLPKWMDGSVSAVEQDSNLATYTSKLERADGFADWALSAGELARRLRAYTPWPGLHTQWDGKEVKLLEVEPVPGAGEVGTVTTSTGGAPIVVGTGEGLLVVRRLQLEGRRVADAEDFVRGYPQFIGARLG